MPHVLVPPSEGELFLSQQQSVSELFIKQGNKKKRRKIEEMSMTHKSDVCEKNFQKKGFGSRYFEKKVVVFV